MSSREIWQNRVTKELEALGRPVARCADALTRPALRFIARPFRRHAENHGLRAEIRDAAAIPGLQIIV